MKNCWYTIQYSVSTSFSLLVTRSWLLVGTRNFSASKTVPHYVICRWKVCKSKVTAFELMYLDFANGCILSDTWWCVLGLLTKCRVVDFWQYCPMFDSSCTLVFYDNNNHYHAYGMHPLRVWWQLLWHCVWWCVYHHSLAWLIDWLMHNLWIIVVVSTYNYILVTNFKSMIQIYVVELSGSHLLRCKCLGRPHAPPGFDFWFMYCWRFCAICGDHLSYVKFTSYMQLVQ